MATTDCGNNGEVPYPDWLGMVASWTHEQIDSYIGEHATAGPLNRDQVTALLQQRPPPAAGWESFPSVLDEYAGIVDRWDADVARSAVPASPLPNELASWCDHMKFALPQPFVDRLRTTGQESATPAQSIEPVAYPSWAPMTRAVNAIETAKRGRGRPKGSAAANTNMQQDAKKMLLEHADNGNLLTIPDIARALSQRPEYSRLDKATLTRRLNGELPWAMAREMAQRARK